MPRGLCMIDVTKGASRDRPGAGPVGGGQDDARRKAGPPGRFRLGPMVIDGAGRVGVLLRYYAGHRKTEG